MYRGEVRITCAVEVSSSWGKVESETVTSLFSPTLPLPGSHTVYTLGSEEGRGMGGREGREEGKK